MDKIQAALELLKQPSTYKGIIILLGLIGWRVSPVEYQDAITGLISLYAVIAIFWQKS